jgi:hypothetical protein
VNQLLLFYLLVLCSLFFTGKSQYRICIKIFTTKVRTSDIGLQGIYTSYNSLISSVLTPLSLLVFCERKDKYFFVINDG